MKKAAALSYNPYKNNAPKIIASGKGAIAQQIIQKAQEYEVPLFSNTALVDSLIGIEINEEIPQELYHGVVEVFIWLEKCEQKAQISQKIKG